MTKEHQTNSKFSHKDVSHDTAELEDDGLGGELDEIVDEFNDGRISYGCRPLNEAGTNHSRESRRPQYET